MGRRKVEIKKIEDKSSRQVTFSKRRNGLIKKARDLSVLCDADVALIVISSSGKLYEFSGKAHSLASIVRRYQSHSEAEEKRESKNAEYVTSEELLQIVQRYMEEPSGEDPSLPEILQLEKELDAALTQIKSKKTELMIEPIASLLEKERVLREQNSLLEQQMISGRKKKSKCYNRMEEEMLPGEEEEEDEDEDGQPLHATLSLLPP